MFNLLFTDCCFYEPLIHLLPQLKKVNLFVWSFVCLDQSKSSEQILMKFFGKVGVVQRPNDLDFGSNLMTPSLFCPNFFAPVLHFQWDRNSEITLKVIDGF